MALLDTPLTALNGEPLDPALLRDRAVLTFNEGQRASGGLDVRLTQLRNLLAGTRPVKIIKDGEVARGLLA